MDDVVLSPAHKSVAGRFFAGRSPRAASQLPVAGLAWICACCEAENSSQQGSCNICLVPRGSNVRTVAAQAASTPQPTSGGFSFGEAAGSAPPQGFSFGTGGSAAAVAASEGFAFGGDASTSGGFDSGFTGGSNSAPTSFGMREGFAMPASIGGGGGFAAESAGGFSMPSDGGFTMPTDAGFAMPSSGFLMPPSTGFTMTAASSTPAAGGATWVCKCCEAENSLSASICNICMVPNPSAPKAAMAFSFPDQPIVSSSSSSSSSSSWATPVTPARAPAAADAAAPTSAGWICKCCETENSASAASCNTCMVPNPNKPQPKVTLSAVPVVAATAPAESAWTCQVCDSRNDAAVIQCDVCSVVRKGTAAKSAPVAVAAVRPASFVPVVLSERHQAFANAFFAQRKNQKQQQQRLSMQSSPFTPPTEKSGFSSPSSGNNSVNDVTFNLTPVHAGTARKRAPDFVSPEALRYEKKQITKDAVVPSPVATPGGWKCATCDWSNHPSATHCVLCLDRK